MDKLAEGHSILLFLLYVKHKPINEVSFELAVPEELITKWLSQGKVSHQGADAIFEVYG